MAVRPRILAAWIVTFALALSSVTAPARAMEFVCPFCDAVAKTFSEEMEAMDVSVIVRLVKVPPKSDEKSDELPKARFEVIDILRGEQHVELGDQFDALYFGNGEVGKMFVVWGVEPPAVNWATPLPVTERGHKYLRDSLKLPKEGADRLAFFQDFLEDKDEMLARDAYDEFARSSYTALQDLKPRMKREQLIAWIKDKDIPASRRRLYLCMMSVCGTKDDIPFLEEMVRSTDSHARSSLDALIASYLSMKGADGLPLIEELFLSNKDAAYSDIYSAIMSLRFHGTEGGVIDRKRLVESMRLLLKNPKLADLIIPDLARWEDWESLETLVVLFKEADDKTSWIRVPVVNYLRSCPLPRAKEALAELEKIDPQSVERAKTFFPVINNQASPAATPAPPGTGAGAAIN
jgi:hypothetical protein